MNHNVRFRVPFLSFLLGIVAVSTSSARQPLASAPINRLKESVQLTINSVDAKWGIYMKSMATGEELSINVVSDNTATEVLYRMVGGIAPVNARMKVLGFPHTRAVNIPSRWFAGVSKLREDQLEPTMRQGKLPFGITTPREMGRLLEMLEKKTLVDAKSSEIMIGIMRNQVYRTRIPRYLGYLYEIPHKTGDFPPFIANDVGVLEMPGANIVMSIFTANHTGRYDVLENAIGLIAQDARNYFAYRTRP